MNIGADYYLAIFLKNGEIVAKTTVYSYFKNEDAARSKAEEFAKEHHIPYDTVDVTFTHEEQF